METREALRRRRDVDDDDIDDIVAIAQELQDAADDDGRVSVAEVEDIAEELDIDPRFVEAAIAELGRRRQTEAQARVEEAEQAAAQRALRSRVAKIVAAVMAAVTLATGAVAMSGRSQLLAAQQDVRSAEAALQVVVERQASLVPRLVAMQGVESVMLSEAASRVQAAPTAEAQLAASADLDAALAEALGRLPESVSADQRTELQYELVGAQSRITTEQRRYREAVAEWQGVADGVGPSLAIAVGLAEPPPVQ